MKEKSLAEKLTLEGIELLKNLIKTPSVSRNEDKTAELIFNYLKSHGVAQVNRHLNNVWAISKNFDENKFQSVFLLDLYMGYRTFSTPYVENRIYAGPTLLFSDFMEKGDQEPLESHFGVGFHFGTTFDFYFTKYQEKGQLRLGLRLFASISNYYTDVVKGSDGGTLTLTLTPLLQYYELREKKYGER